MARRGGSKARSVEQEELIATFYKGKRSPSSGAAETDAGDVRTDISLIECKTTGYPGKEPRPQLPQFVRWLEKIHQEAIEENKSGMLAMRFYAPESVLADRDGWVDIAIRPLFEDVLRDRSHDWCHKHYQEVHEWLDAKHKVHEE